MEPNKLETQFREQLNSREIKPSEMAWTKLDAMLSAAEKPKAKFPWLYVAASFAGLLLIGTVYFTSQENTIENQKNGVVIQNPVAPKAKLKPLDSVHLKIEKKESVVQVVQKSVSKSNQPSELKQESIIVKNNQNQNQVAGLSIINQKTEQESISLQTNAVTVDELLARVDKSARLNNQTNPNLQVHVNPNQLLQQVDNDLEPSYRQNVFSKVAENFKAVKDAFVNRNKE
ncbi:hypothetical protein [Flavobacterium undicola]|uniref:hypothetical protein n=1 Tax=Flavobacterium undicola TaxID=1932779 RepID=UPI0013778B2F|nr:hypothetical protein [Flavobacterium undicola]MBA0884539.1 hypothetical protein [Flavobacterium undicola]